MSATLWMGDVEPYMDEAFLTNAFRTMGEEVKQVKLIRNRYTGEQASYCFVEFHSSDAAHKAMLKLNGKILPSTQPQKRFKLNHASYGREHLLTSPEYSLFVGDLTEDVDDLALYNTFYKRYKSTKAAKVVLDISGKSRGYGFVRFGEESEQKKALTEMQYSTGLGGKPIRVSMATPKSARQWNNMYSQGYGSYNGYNYGYNYGNYGNYDYSSYYNNYSNYWGQAGYDYYGQQTQGYDQSGMPTAEGAVENGESQIPDDDPEEDPELEIDVAQWNKDFIQKSEEFYDCLEGSRWHPLDTVYSEISTKN